MATKRAAVAYAKEAQGRLQAPGVESPAKRKRWNLNARASYGISVEEFLRKKRLEWLDREQRSGARSYVDVAETALLRPGAGYGE